MRKKLSGGRYLMLETRKDGTKFTSKGLKEAAERLQGISRSYDQRQHALVEQVHIAAEVMMMTGPTIRTSIPHISYSCKAIQAIVTLTHEAPPIRLHSVFPRSVHALLCQWISACFDALVGTTGGPNRRPLLACDGPHAPCTSSSTQGSRTFLFPFAP